TYLTPRWAFASLMMDARWAAIFSAFVGSSFFLSSSLDLSSSFLESSLDLSSSFLESSLDLSSSFLESSLDLSSSFLESSLDLSRPSWGHPLTFPPRVFRLTSSRPSNPRRLQYLPRSLQTSRHRWTCPPAGSNRPGRCHRSRPRRSIPSERTRWCRTLRPRPDEHLRTAAHRDRPCRSRLTWGNRGDP